MVIGNAYYVGSTGDLYSNAGNYGMTTPVSLVSHSPSHSPSTFESQAPPRVDQRTIGVPQEAPVERIIPEPRRNGISTVPSVEQLLQQPRGTMPNSRPVSPPERPRVVPPAFEDTPIESVPFSPSDETSVPKSTIPTTMNPKTTHTEPGLQITLEELRRLDPSVHDVQIISIEDAGVGTPVR
jgi:hypothetical protein